MQPQAHLSMESMCRLAAVSRAGFYRHWHEREPCVEEMELRAQVQQIVVRHRRNYGYRRVARELRDQGWVVNRKRVARIMAEDNLLCIRLRRWICPVFCVNDQAFLGLLLGMGCKGRGQFPFPCVHVEKELRCIMPTFPLAWACARAIGR